MKAAHVSTKQANAKLMAVICIQAASCKLESGQNRRRNAAYNVPLHSRPPGPASADTFDDGPAFPGWQMSRRQ